MWECGQGEVWVVLHVETWCTAVSSCTIGTWKENYHSDPVASQTSWDGRLGRCDGPGRLGKVGQLGRCDRPGRLCRSDQDSADDESAGVHDSAAGDGPEVVDDSAGVADPAHEKDSAGVADSADRQDSAVDNSARGDGPVAQGTPAGTTPAAAFTPDRQGQDTTIVSDASRWFSRPFWDRSTRLPYLTLCQWWPQCNVGWTWLCQFQTPVAQTPMFRDDQTPPRRSRTPVRRSRTPVRHSKGMDESRDSTRSRSPIRRSSFSESSLRDASPVDFSAVLDSAEKVKDKSISDEEDDEGSQESLSGAIPSVSPGCDVV